MSDFHNDGIELTEEQRQRAEEALERIENGQATHPRYLLNKWEACPDWREINDMCDGNMYEETNAVEKWVSVSDIVGTIPSNIDRLINSRIKSAFQRLLDGQFRPDYDQKPQYIEIGGDLYVGSDGIHRSIACKVIGLDEILANVSEIPVNEAVYQRWAAQRDGKLVQTQDKRQFSEMTVGEQTASTNIGKEIMVALGLHHPPTSTPEILSYTPNPEQCDNCGKSSHYVLEYVEAQPRQILGIESPWSKFQEKSICYKCWLDSSRSKSYYTPDDPALLFDEDMP